MAKENQKHDFVLPPRRDLGAAAARIDQDLRGGA